MPMLRFLIRRVLAGLAILLITSFGSVLIQNVALRTRQNQAAPIVDVVRVSLDDTVEIWRGLFHGDLGTYESSSFSFYGSGDTPLSQRLGWYMLNSLMLLFFAMLLGGLVGGLIGVLSAATRRPGASLTLVLFSILGISTPSFLLGMVLQLLEISIYKNTGIRIVPVGGYGWDSHLVLPLLVLSARPIAQVARLTFVRISDVLAEDYVRTAQSKGLAERTVWRVHVIPNAAATVLTAAGTSLRFAMSSLPVIETLFGWPGAGRVLLEMLGASQVQGATIIILCFGASILLVNMLLDLVYRVLDPRLREAVAQLRAETRWSEWVVSLADGLWSLLTLRRWRERRNAQADRPASLAGLAQQNSLRVNDRVAHERAMRRARRRTWLKAVSGNQALWLGVPLGICLLVIVIAGPALAPHSVNSLALNLSDNATVLQAPSATYPLGTDSQGRDVLSLLLVGARRTLSIAFFAVAARLLIGGVLGFLAGWFSGSRLDRAIMGLGEVTASFPALLLAMLVIYAVGIRQGLVAFVIGLAVVGWAEVMQSVRSQVMALKPMAFIEGAVASGATEGTIMSSHVLPNLWPTMLSLAFLEMGGVLMLLGELGFLGVFIGKGLQAQGDDLPQVVYYDVPEWSVMLASSSSTYRSYPWATLYPALAFFVAIWAFTLLGEGLRRLTERLTLSFRSLFNRYTLVAAVLLVLGVRWMFNSTNLYATYAASATSFSTKRALADIQTLAGAELNGRLSGSADADTTAEWIAAQFEALGMQGAGERLRAGDDLMGFGYYQHFTMSIRDLVGAPSLTLTGSTGETINARYGLDFGHSSVTNDLGGSATGMVDILAEQFSWGTSAYLAAEALGISAAEVESSDRFILRLNSESSEWSWVMGSRGTWTLDSSAATQFRHQLLSQEVQGDVEDRIYLDVSDELVERLLEDSGSSLENLEKQIPTDADDAPLYLRTGWRADVDMLTEWRESVPMLNVLAVWPGVDVDLDHEVVIVSAYYDGLGRLADGTLYPSANDNASGVATMLEMIRTLQEQDFQPRRTLVFVAWCGGQRHEAPNYDKYMQAHTGFDTLEIVAALELEGVGGGSGSSAVAWRSTSQRLTEVAKQAAKRVGTRIDTRQAGLHADTSTWPATDSDVPSLTLSWAGADDFSATPGDTAEAIDPDKLGQVGRMASLALMVLAADPAY